MPNFYTLSGKCRNTLPDSGTAWIFQLSVAIFPALCYTLSRCKALKNKVLSGLPAVTAVKCAECSWPSTHKTKLKEKNIMKKSNKVTFLTQAAVIAAIYVVLTIIFAPFSFGEVQVRISEALTVLPFFTPAAYYCQPVRRCNPCWYYFRQHCHTAWSPRNLCPA